MYFGNINQSAWVYDPLYESYLRYVDTADPRAKGALHPEVDRLTGRQLHFENVIVIMADIEVVSRTNLDIHLDPGNDGPAQAVPQRAAVLHHLEHARRRLRGQDRPAQTNPLPQSGWLAGSAEARAYLGDHRDAVQFVRAARRGHLPGQVRTAGGEARNLSHHGPPQTSNTTIPGCPPYALRLVQACLTAILLLATGCGPRASVTATPAPAPQPTVTPTAEPRPPLNPLTGLEVEDPSLLKMPAVLISISHFPATARPQAGLSFCAVRLRVLHHRGRHAIPGGVPRRVAGARYPGSRRLRCARRVPSRRSPDHRQPGLV